MLRKITLWVIMFMILFSLSACDVLFGALESDNTQPSLLDDSLLRDDSFVSDEPCAPPCWRGIIPDETTWNDALNIIRNDPQLDNLQTRSDMATKQIGAAWAQKDGANCCQMFSQDGETVSFIVAQTTPDILFGEVIAKHGEPSYLIGDTVDNGQALVSVYYVDIPMLIYVFVESPDSIIASQNPVVGFAYLSDRLMTELLQTTNLYAWDGFKTFNDYMLSDFELTPEFNP